VSVGVTVTSRELSSRWPHIGQWLRLEPSGWVKDHYVRWYFAHEKVSLPSVEMAAAYLEWADFYEFRLAQRTDELAADPGLRGLVEEWTDDMAYCCRRCAAHARGEDPGEWVPQWERRPELAAAKRARVAKIIAKLDAQRQPAEQPARHVLWASRALWPRSPLASVGSGRAR
jgi:hypothetical protein